MKFAIITYILHKEHENSYYSYEPYIREMNIWIRHVDEVIVVAPKISAIPGIIETSYKYNNISFRNIPSISFLNLPQILRSLLMIPKISLKIILAMSEADHIHLRCPGNIGLIASLLQIFFPNKSKTVKYAGNWDPNSSQPWSYRLQKWILGNTFLSRNIKVLVYGEWPNQSSNILPFFTASFSETEKVLYEKNITTPFKFMFVGSLTVGKRPLFAIQLVESLLKWGISCNLEIYGTGEVHGELQEYIDTNRLKEFVSIKGNYKLEDLKEVYVTSHFLILASKSEGWPKAIAEAMFFGCIPIATSVSCVPYMLDHGRRGILIQTNSEKAANSLIAILMDERKLIELSKKAMTWSNQYTLEKFENEIKELL